MKKTKITADRLKIMQEKLADYMSAKQSFDARLIENEKWFRSEHWQLISNENQQDIREPITAFLFNAIANKHAEIMDNFPYPNILAREFDDEKEAEILSKIIKDYLFKRFGISFSSSTTTEIPVLFEEIFAGTLSNEQQDGIDKICGILHRCDYIRYAPQAKMEPEERFSIIALTKEIIFSFEKEIS